MKKREIMICMQLLTNSLCAPSVSKRSPHWCAVHITALSEIFTYLKIVTFKYQKWIRITHAHHNLHHTVQHKHIWLGQVFTKRYHSKCAHTILYHSFRLRWSLLVCRPYIELSAISVLYYWTICNQKPLVTSQSYIHRLSALLIHTSSLYTKGPLCMGRTLFSSMRRLALPWIEQTREWS